jgi:glutamate carboxypeptidase
MQYDPNQSVGSAIGKDNIISPRVVVTGDLRFLSEVQKENARAKMREIVSNNLTGTTAKISFEDGIPSMEPTAGNAKILDVIDGISSSLGQGKTVAGNPGARGAGDISYIAAYVDCVDGLGATGSGAHAPGEKIKLNDLPYLIKRAALLIYRLTNSAD